MKAVIWDLDNTIVDTEELHRRAWQTITRQHGIEGVIEQFIPFELYGIGGENRLHFGYF